MTSISIFYYPEENVFKDSKDRVIFEMLKLVTPNEIFLFKHKKETTEIINRKYGIIVKLLYPIN
jgi:hypothetical protein